MNGTDKRKSRLYGTRALLVSAGAGLAGGAVLCGVLVWTVMPSVMILSRESQLGFDETVLALQKSIEARGWVVSGVVDMNKSMAQNGVELGPRVKLVKLCKPEYAKSVLTTHRHVSTMMPCTFGIWEGDDGRVFVSKMNMRLMAKMFGGNVARVMGEQVAEDEEKILAGITKG